MYLMSFLCSLWNIYIDLFCVCSYEREMRERELICRQWRGPGTGARSHGLQLTLEMKRLQGADEPRETHCQWTCGAC